MKYKSEGKSWRKAAEDGDLDRAIDCISRQIATNLIDAHNHFSKVAIEKTEKPEECTFATFEAILPEYRKLLPSFLYLRDEYHELLRAREDVHTNEGKSVLLDDFARLEMACEAVFSSMDDEGILRTLCETIVEDEEELKHILEQINSGYAEKGEQANPLREIYDRITAIYGDIIEYPETMCREVKTIHTLGLRIRQKERMIFGADEAKVAEDQLWEEACNAVQELLGREIYYLAVIECILDDDCGGPENKYYEPFYDLDRPIVPSFARETKIEEIDYSKLNCAEGDPSLPKVIRISEQAVQLMPEIDKNIQTMTTGYK